MFPVKGYERKKPLCSWSSEQFQDRLRLHRAGGGAETTVDQALIRGLSTAFRVFVSPVFDSAFCQVIDRQG